MIMFYTMVVLKLFIMNQNETLPKVIGKINIVDNSPRTSYSVCDSCKKKFYGSKIHTLYVDHTGQKCKDCIEKEEMEYWESLCEDTVEKTIFE